MSLPSKQQPHSFFGFRQGKRAKGPGIVQRSINYGKAVVRYRRNHGFILPLEMAEERHGTCRSNVCGKYDARTDHCLHRRCGCPLKEKTTWSTEKCPDEHWLAVFGPAPAAPPA